jgi:hypothetical protein
MPLDADAMVKLSLGTLLGGRSEDSIFHIMRILVFVVRSRRNASMDLFTPLVEEEKLHKNFIRTIARTGGGVREVLKYWADGFADRDGKFVREFQTTYNSSFWELYLFAVLKHLGIKADFTFTSPDFVLTVFRCGDFFESRAQERSQTFNHKW